MASTLRYLAWRVGLFIPKNPVEKRIYELKAKGLSAKEAETQIKQEFQLRFYGTDGKEVRRRPSTVTENKPIPQDEQKSPEEVLSGARKDFQERLKSDPELKGRVEAHRTEKATKARERRAAQKGLPKND